MNPTVDKESRQETQPPKKPPSPSAREPAGQQFRLVQHFRQDGELAPGQFLVKDLPAGLRVLSAVDIVVRVFVPVVIFQYQMPARYPGHIVIADAPDLQRVAQVAARQHQLNLERHAAPAKKLPEPGNVRNAG